MSKRDFDRYFASVIKDRSNFLEELKDMQKCYEDCLVDPKVYDQMKSVFNEIDRNYKVLNYVDFLLNKPVKKTKHAKYNKQYKKKLEDCIGETQIKEEHTKAFTDLEKLKAKAIKQQT